MQTILRTTLLHIVIERAGWHWSGKQIPLAKLTAKVRQRRLGAQRFNAFGGGLQPQAAGHLNDRGNDGQVLFVAAQVGDSCRYARFE